MSSEVNNSENLSREDLTRIISDLKSQVSNLKKELRNCKGSSTIQATEKASKKTKKKFERPFDFKRFHKRHIALRVAYLGWDYHGFAAQENIDTTIEFFLFEALLKTKLIEDRPSSNYSRCGRTDKGVSAFGQVITLDVRSNLREGLGVIQKENSTTEPGKDVRNVKELDYVNMLNRVLPPDIRALAWAPVDPSYSARFDCQYRTYKYFFPQGNLDIQLMKEASRKLIGEHDFRNFCKMDVANGVVTFIRRIVSVDIQPVDSREDGFQMYEVTISGLAFLYHQIRCIVAILFMIGQHREKSEIIDELLDVSKNPRKPQYSMAAEYPLVLYDCGYEAIDWIYSDDHQQHNITSLQSIWTNHCIRAAIVKRMLDGLDIAPVLDIKIDAGTGDKKLVPWQEAREKISKQSERLTLGLPSSTHQPLLKRKRCESLEDRIAHFTKKGRGPKVKSKEGDILVDDDVSETMDST
ncbi:tRNA pseudouridine(38/39) synthase-like [Apostichopus japonicus]|uniref:tRNA pseudouridine(38/39) synthase-like n=1 Tax=Stichopus japonicus TaxID=307972 RepID=UPI003AB6C6A7